MINLTKVSPTLNKNHTTWIKQNNHNYIMGEHFIFKTNQDIKGSLLTKLISLLNTIPGEGQGIRNRYGYISQLTDVEIKNMLELLECKTNKTITFTNLIHQTDKDLFSIFHGEDYIFVNKKYTDIMNSYTPGIEGFGSNRVSPVYFHKGNEEIMILPVEIGQPPIYLKEVTNV